MFNGNGNGTTAAEYLMNSDYIEHLKKMDKAKIVFDALKDLYQAELISGESYKEQVAIFVKEFGGYDIDIDY